MDAVAAGTPPALRVLVIGATGFIGRHLVRALEARGHRARCAGRDRGDLERLFPGHEHAALDLAAEGEAELAAALAGVDGVVNAAGLIASEAVMRAVHAEGPVRLFRAARAAGIGRLVQVSALGAAPDAPTEFLRGKAAADADVLADRPPGWTVVRPSLVYGPGGGSAGLFAALAALPVQFRVGGGAVRPIQVDDLAEGICRLLEAEAPLPPVLDAVGPEETSVDGFVAGFRRWLGRRPAWPVRVPPALLALAGRFGGGLVSRDTLLMLERGATADHRPLTAVTGVEPAGIAAGLARTPATEGDRIAAGMRFLRLPLRWSLAFMWVVSGVVSLGLYPVDESLGLLAAVGVTGPLALPVLYAASAWDVLLGLALFLGRRVRLWGWVQVATMLGYTAILTLFLPELWLHPFGPVFKNVPILVATLAMIAVEE
jgi:uncharacterized protein YbjT (DUF2867 family)/uncharacterized membrane protein YphA (DoxX/SURF4 family)